MASGTLRPTSVSARAGCPLLDRTAATVYFADPDGHRVGLTVHPRDRMTAPGTTG
jgi:hypothetical protein